MEQYRITELQERLKTLHDMNIKDIDPESLAEMKDLAIDTNLPVRDRLLSLIKQTGNPYAYRSGGK